MGNMWQSQTYAIDRNVDLLRVLFLCCPHSPFWHLQPLLQAVPCISDIYVFFILLKWLKFLSFLFHNILLTITPFIFDFPLISFSSFQEIIFSQVFPSLSHLWSTSFFFPSTHFTLLLSHISILCFFCYWCILTHSESRMNVRLVLKCK